jgi:hypothetical protein
VAALKCSSPAFSNCNLCAFTLAKVFSFLSGRKKQQQQQLRGIMGNISVSYLLEEENFARSLELQLKPPLIDPRRRETFLFMAA